MKFLVTRPEPGASATAARLAAMGHEAVIAPCLKIVPLAAKLPEDPAAVIVTSGQAISALPEAWRNIPVFCVGDATASKLRAAGFTRVESAGGNSSDLLRLVTARQVPGLHMLAVGERQGLALARHLGDAGILVKRTHVYAAKPARALPEAVRAALAAGEITGALFYSAETARVFARLAPQGTAAMAAYALSPAVAEAAKSLPWREIHVALAPSEADLMALIS